MSKGRIQLDFVDVNKTSLFQRYRFYFHPDVALYRQFPKRSNWLNLSAMWMGRAWKGHKYPFKLSLIIFKPNGVGTALYFSAGGGRFAGGIIGRGKWKDVWYKVATNFEVPVGEWIDVEVGYKTGDRKMGRYYMGVKRKNDKAFTTIFDVADWTYHPKSQKPVPIINVNPLKLYSSSHIIDFIRNNGGVGQVY